MPRRKASAEVDEGLDQTEKRTKGDEIVDAIVRGDKLPQQQLSPKQFWRLIAEYPQRDAAAVYIYRAWPVIDRSITGNNSNIEIVQLDGDALNEEVLLDHHGSGKYKLFLSDANRGSGYTGVAHCFVKLTDPQRQPVIHDLRELVLEDRDNSSFVAGLRSKGLLPPEGDMAEGKAVETLAGIVKEQLAKKPEAPIPAGSDPSFIAAIAKLMDVMKPAPAPPAADPLEIALKIAELMRANAPAAAPVPATATSELDMIDRVLKLEDRLAERRGGENGSGGWSAFLGAVPGIMRELNGLLDRTMLIRATAPPAAAPGAPSMTTPLPPRPAAPEEDLNIARLIRVGQQAVNAFQSGRSGEDFADSLHMLDVETFTQIRQLGFDGVYGALKTNPELAQLDGPEVEAWLREFFSYDPHAEESTDDEVSPTSPAAALAALRER